MRAFDEWLPVSSSVVATSATDPSMPLKLQQPGVLMKTGSLSQVRSIAGYVISKSGQVYALTSIINHPMAPSGGPVHDALLTWLLEDGLNDLK